MKNTWLNFLVNASILITLTASLSGCAQYVAEARAKREAEVSALKETWYRSSSELRNCRNKYIKKLDRGTETYSLAVAVHQNCKREYLISNRDYYYFADSTEKDRGMRMSLAQSWNKTITSDEQSLKEITEMIITYRAR